MASYPYATVTGKIKDLFNKIRNVSVPGRVGLTWLKANGFTSSADRTLLSILKGIDLIDSAGIPTERWRDCRRSGNSVALAGGIRIGYKELFDHYGDANLRSDAELKDFFKATSGVSNDTITKIIASFRALCALADFTTDMEVIDDTNTILQNAPLDNQIQLDPIINNLEINNPRNDTTININIQLNIPESADPDVYECLFAAMKKHLWSR